MLGLGLDLLKGTRSLGCYGFRKSSNIGGIIGVRKLLGGVVAPHPAQPEEGASWGPEQPSRRRKLHGLTVEGTRPKKQNSSISTSL